MYFLEWKEKENQYWMKKCEECWSSYIKGIQHKNSLKCWKLGIPFSSIKNLNEAIKIIDKIIEEFKNVTYKYSKNFGILKIISKGIIIIYFESKIDMLKFIIKFKKEARDILKDASFLDNLFYKFIVNTNKIDNHFYYRRGCPEYDFKFGSWRKWKS
ncbi:MAG: hypothetical protein RQ922_04080 [Thermoproteota archaeon]|nr:hypothetical protein [Thermoproteota archaeon]